MRNLETKTRLDSQDDVARKELPLWKTYMRAHETHINITGASSMLSDENTRRKNGPASYTHTHTHTNVHIHIHTCTHTYIHPHMRTHTLTHIYARMHTRMHAHTPHTHVHASTLYKYLF